MVRPRWLTHLASDMGNVFTSHVVTLGQSYTKRTGNCLTHWSLGAISEHQGGGVTLDGCEGICHVCLAITMNGTRGNRGDKSDESGEISKDSPDSLLDGICGLTCVQKFKTTR